MVRIAVADGRLSTRVVDLGALMEALSPSECRGGAGGRGADRDREREKIEGGMRRERNADSDGVRP